MQTHTIRGFDPETLETLEVGIQCDSEFVSIREKPTGKPYREALIEYSNGTLCVRLYSMDSDAPLNIRLPETGGIEIDRHDYDNARKGIV